MKTKIIAITVAMDSELELIRESIDAPYEYQEQTFKFITGTIKGNDDIRVIVSKSGIGKVNSAICTSKIIEKFSPDVFISTGVCGCLNKTAGITQGDLLVVLGITYHDAYCGGKIGQIQDMPLEFKSSFLSEDFVERTINTKTIDNIYGCRMISGDWFVDTKEKALSIYNEMCKMHEEIIYGIDMESGSISQTCYIYGVPFIGIRIVSDTPLVENSPSYDDFWQNAPDRLNDALIKFIDYLND